MFNPTALVAAATAALSGLAPMSSVPSLPVPLPIPSPAPAPAPQGPTVSRDQAINIALNHAGVAHHEARFDDVELDHDDGRLSWEIEFDARGWEYEYDIDAHSGVIIEFERDWDD